MGAIVLLRPNKLGVHTFNELEREMIKLGVPTAEDGDILFDNVMDHVALLALQAGDSYFAAVGEGVTKTPEGLVEDRCNKAIRVLELAKIYSKNFGF